MFGMYDDMMQNFMDPDLNQISRQMGSPFGRMGNIEEMMEGFMEQPHGNPRHAFNR
jgi:hypothetical protein